jgi:hypothetical protein
MCKSLFIELTKHDFYIEPVHCVQNENYNFFYNEQYYGHFKRMQLKEWV